MDQIFSATYVDGVLRPDQPLDLPEQSRVRVVVQAASVASHDPRVDEPAVRLSVEEFLAEFHAPCGAVLPPGFSRADIYDADQD